MAGVFIAHSSADKPFARRLAADLVGHGQRVWLDEAELRVGDSLLERLGEAVTQMDHLAVLLSRISVESSWMRLELRMAMRHEVESGQVKVLPLLLEDCSPPPFIADKVWADFREPAKYHDSLRLVLRTLKVPEREELNIFFDGWSQPSAELGVTTSLLVTKNGRLALSDAFKRNLSEACMRLLMEPDITDDLGYTEPYLRATLQTIGAGPSPETEVDANLQSLIAEVVAKNLDECSALAHRLGLLHWDGGQFALTAALAEDVVDVLFAFMPGENTKRDLLGLAAKALYQTSVHSLRAGGADRQDAATLAWFLLSALDKKIELLAERHLRR